MSEQNEIIEEEVAETTEKAGTTDEDKARAQGWADKDEWKGDPDKWKPAKQFLEDGERINAVLRERLDKVTEESIATKSELKRLREATESLISHHEEQKRKAVEKAIKSLRTERDQAIEEGNKDRVNELDEEINRTKAEVVVKSDTKFADWTQAFDAWKTDNDWYGSDMRMTVEADELGGKFFRSGRFDTSESILKEVEKEMKRAFPSRFRNPNKDSPSSVEASTKTTVTPTKKRGYNDLPADAKKACDSFVRDIPGYTREQYLKSYEWE